ncbi:PIG-X [Xylariomycetidae sp. FL2044]|nr:PIG-X [Xylariomycetidae sp. FL2044]
MRERITLFHRNGNAPDPGDLEIAGRSISGPELTALREHRVTLALEELPVELQNLLQDSHELHIRWESPQSYEPLGPWNSRVPPGLHLFYTPQKAETANSRQLCHLLRTAFGVRDCESVAESFTRLPNDRFSHSTAYQYFQPLESLSNFSKYTEKYTCPSGDAECKEWAHDLERAASLDVAYDTISHVLKVTALWPEGRQTLDFSSHPDHRTEVGLLMPDDPPHLEPHELGVTGALTVLGEDTKPSPVLFSFPSRHQTAKSSFSSTFLRPWGLHPTLQLQLSSSRPPNEDATCSLHAYMTLPRTIFADEYQLGDQLFLSSKNLTALRYISQPVDLEAPDYAMKLWGSSILLELAPPSPGADEPWTAEIPLHLRYLAPAESGYQNISIPSPVVFWACAAEEGTKFPNSPFDRVNLGYDGLFGPRTLFRHVQPRTEEGGTLNHQIQVPVLDLAKSGWVNAGTTVVVLLGFTLVVWKLVSVYMASGYKRSSPGKASEKKTQ